MSEHMKAKVIELIKNGPQGNAVDNLNRAKSAYYGLCDAQMEMQYGQSGSTRKEILDGYQDLYDELQKCIDWLENL